MASFRKRDPRLGEQRELDERRRREEESLDKTIEDSFPASDPPSTIPNPDDDDKDERAA
jgi:hypothetical protein